MKVPVTTEGPNFYGEWICQAIRTMSNGQPIPEPWVFNYCINNIEPAKVLVGISELQEGRGRLDPSEPPQYQLAIASDTGKLIISTPMFNDMIFFDLTSYVNTLVLFTLSGYGRWINPDGLRIPANSMEPATLSLIVH